MGVTLSHQEISVVTKFSQLSNTAQTKTKAIDGSISKNSKTNYAVTPKMSSIEIMCENNLPRLTWIFMLSLNVCLISLIFPFFYSSVQFYQTCYGVI